MIEVTQRAVVLTSLQGLNGNLAALSKLQQQMTSGTQISPPSDAPTGTNTSLIIRQGISGAASTPGTSPTARPSSTPPTRRCRTCSARSGGCGTSRPGAERRRAVRRSCSGDRHRGDGIRESMLGQANLVVQGRPLFGGSTAGNGRPTTRAATTWAWAAAAARGPADDPAGVAVEPIRVDITGPEAFGDPASGKDLFGWSRTWPPMSATGGAVRGPRGPGRRHRRLVAPLADIGTRSARMDRAP